MLRLLSFISLLVLVGSRGGCHTTGTVLFFGKKLHHSLIVGNHMGSYKYYPSINEIHSDQEDVEKYMVCIHRVPQLYLPISRQFNS